MYTKDIIVAPATPPGEGGVAIVRLSGLDCLKLSLQFFRSSASSFLPLTHTFYHGFFHSLAGDLVDEVLFVYMAAPRSFTAEDVVEIHCHGGSQSLNLIITAFLSAGARLANPGEFSYRAFLNGRIDLVQAEATAALISSQSESSQRLAMAQLEGSLSKFLFSASQVVRESLAFIEAWIDFPEEDLPEVDLQHILLQITELKKSLTSLLDTFNTGRLYTEGATVMLVGKPNVGKSSLLNALLKEDRAIVTNIPGTTTDLIEESVLIHGINIRIIDTAGLTETDNVIESLGILRARKKLDSAHLLLFVIDANAGFTLADESALSLCREHLGRLVLILNKSDLPVSTDIPAHIRENSLSVSTLTGLGLDVLKEKIAKSLLGGLSLPRVPLVLTDIRHKDAASRALLAIERFLAIPADTYPLELLSFELREALFHLGEITGESASTDVLDLIFSKFCIGK